MKIIRNEKMNLNILIPEDGYLLKDKNDNGEVLEDGTVIPPYLTDKIYLASSIQTIDQCQELWEEVIKDEESN